MVNITNHSNYVFSSGKQQGRVNEMIKMECPKVVDTVDIEVSNIFFFFWFFILFQCSLIKNLKPAS